MPILEINILGSNIEISYQEGEKEKLLYLVKQFKLRLSKFENLKVRFADFKIILLAALKAEDIIYELKQTIDNQNNVIESSSIQQGQIDNKIREIVKLKDALFLVNEKNKDLEEQNNKTINEIEKLNNKLISLIDKIFNINKNDN
jgi:cell division protein ZapA (FtsZ GTPase activity inhibitor)